MFCLLLQESEKENQEISFLHQSDTCPPQYKEKMDIKVTQMSSEKTNQQPHVTKELLTGSGSNKTNQTECQMVNPEANASRQINEINKTNDPSCRGQSAEMKSVSSQTEDGWHPRDAPVASELHCAYTQTEEEEEGEDEELVASPPVPLSTIARAEDKVLFSGSFPIPADPARLAERIRRNRTQLSAAFDDTEYEPYGLPEVVMKGIVVS